jgi:hypothetical protein
MLRRLWQRWRDRRTVHGRHFDVEIEGRWWSPVSRRAAWITVHLMDCFADEFKEKHRAVARDQLLYGEAFCLTRKHFTPDEWPFADEDPPDPL